MEAFFMERNNLKTIAGVADMSAAATTGARISMKNNKRVAFLVLLGAGVAATATFSLKQHTAGSGGTTKALEVTNPYYVKAGAATKFTRVDLAGVAEDSFDLSTTFVTDAGIAVFEVLEEDLDTNGGFTHVSLDAADAGGTARLGAILAVTPGAGLPAYDLDL